MADKRLEWFPLYYERFLLATMEWSTVEIGAYFLLLCHQWDKGYIPNDPAEIRKITRTHHRTPIDRVLNKFSKVPQGMANEALLLIRIKQESKSAKNSESGAKGGKKRAENLANATDSLKHIEQNRIRTEQSESTHGPLNTDNHEQKTLSGPGETDAETSEQKSPQATPMQPNFQTTLHGTSTNQKQQNADQGTVVAHWERLRDSPIQLEAFALGARRAGLFPQTMTADQCKERVIKIAEEFQGEFNRVCPEGNYKIFGYKLDDHIKKLATNPNAKPWDPPAAPSALNYSLPPNPNAK